MTKQLTMMVGVAMFAVLALAGAMGIFAFSGSQPVAAQTTNADVIRSFRVATDGTATVDVTITVDNVDSLALTSVTETLPAGWEYELESAVDDRGQAAGVVTGNTGNQQTVSFDIIGESSVTYTVSAPDMAESGTFSGMATIAQVRSADIMGSVGGNPTVTVGTGAINGVDAPDATFELSSYVATEAVRIELDAHSGTRVPAGEDLTVTLKKFGLPADIPESSVLILGTTSSTAGDGAVNGVNREPYSGEPAEVRIEAGNKVVMSLTSRYVNGEAAGPLFADHAYTVVFKKSAGITNPTLAGSTYSIQVADLDSGSHNYKLDGDQVIQSKVKLVPATNAGPRGTALEVTGLGLATGDATIYLSSSETTTGGYRLDNAYASGGIAKVTVDTTTQNFVPGTQDKTSDPTKLEGRNQIYIIDAAGNHITSGNTAQFEITPLIELDGDTFKRGGKVNITVSDWVYGDLHTIEIGGVLVSEVPDGSDTQSWVSKYGDREDRSEGLNLGVDEVEFEFIVPNGARLGEQELKFISHSVNHQGTKGKPDFAKSKIIIGAFDLTIEPSTAVTDQVIKIEGSGFGRDACIIDILVGDQRVVESTSGNRAGSTNEAGERTCGPENDRVEADSNGSLADTFQVPDKLKAGTYRVVIRDSNLRIGIADLVVPKPEIELDPPTSQRGSNVAVIGSNFPAEDVITIDYRGRTVTAANTDTVGRFRATFPVPVNAPIGEEHEVIATSADKADGSDADEPTLKAKALHVVPDEILEVTPATAAPGTRITVKGSNLPLFTLVGVTIGGVGVAGSSVGELAETDGNGEWEGMPLVPQLTPGTHTVEMTVGKGSTGVNVSTFLEIADIITRASDETFEDLIDNGTLTRVWYLEAASQTWSFFDPAPEFAEFNTLTEVSTGQIVTIIMATQDEFQGRSLYVGSNNVAIE